jgi:hypothetical protein
MNKEQKKDMYQFYLKMFLFTIVVYFFMWHIPSPVAKALSILGFSLSTLVILHGVVKTYKGKL